MTWVLDLRALERGNDRHLMPDGPTAPHKPDPHCWCEPVVQYEHPKTGGKLWLHQRRQ